MKTYSKQTPWTYAVSFLFVVGLAILSCGKSDKTADTTPTKSTPTPGVKTSTGNSLTLAGTLAHKSASLDLAASNPDGLIVFSLASGKVIGKPTKIDVAADGTFTLPLTRTNDAIETMKAQVALDPSKRDWDVLLAAASQVVNLEGRTAADLKKMPESDLQQEIAEIAKQLSLAGSMTMLVAYTKSTTGDLIAEAQSFQFIGMPTSEGHALSGIPMGDLKGSIDFGSITGTGTDITSQLTAGDATSLSSSAIEHFAEIGKALKMVKNAYMNSDWAVQPFYVWNGKQSVTDLVDSFSDVSNIAYTGYGFYVKSESKTDLTFADMCGAKSVTFSPPSAISVSLDGSSSKSVTEYNNDNATTSKQGSSDVCNGDGYYARADYNEDKTLSGIMLNFGTGGSILTSPEGLWKLEIDNKTVGNFDLALASATDDKGNPLVLVPEAKFVKTGDNITSVSIKLFRYTSTGYEQVTDFAAVKSLFSGMEASITRSSDKGESRATVEINKDGSITGVFDSSRVRDGEAINAPVAASDVSSFAFAYQIGDANYRTEWQSSK